MDEILFTPAAVIGLLTQIEELKSSDISFNEETMSLSIGDTDYNIEADVAVDVDVDRYTIQKVAQVNEEGYEDLQQEGVEIIDDVPVEGGIVKELVKTLLIGGMVRLNNKYMSQDQFDAYVKQADKYRR